MGHRDDGGGSGRRVLHFMWTRCTCPQGRCSIEKVTDRCCVEGVPLKWSHVSESESVRPECWALSSRSLGCGIEIWSLLIG